MFTVTRQARILAPVAHCWDCLTKPAMLGKWFADVDTFEPGKTFSLSFGDGDFFVGEVKEWREAELLRLVWRFMGIGPQFTISFSLRNLSDNQTQLTVTDQGAMTSDEAAGLSDGWDDFLNRLVKFIETNECTRFRWSETIGVSALLDNATKADVLRLISDHTYWRAFFPDATLSLEHNGDFLEIIFQDESWRGLQTKASIQTRQFGSASYIALTHGGWDDLPETNQIPERRRYARFWEQALRQLEDQSRHNITQCAVRSG